MLHIIIVIDYACYLLDLRKVTFFADSTVCKRTLNPFLAISPFPSLPGIIKFN
nr:hypothetical protein KK467_p0755 [Klebsiella pneumoniae]